MFKVGIYKSQLTTITVLLGILLLGQLSTWVDKAFEPKSISTKANITPDYSDVITDIDVEAKAARYDNSYDDEMLENMRDYQLQIQDNGNKVVLYDGKHIVHVFDRAYKGNANFFHVIDRDNW